MGVRRTIRESGLVTGGAAGLGRAAALQLVEQMDVVVLDTNEVALEDLRRKQPKLHTVHGSVTSSVDVSEAVKTASELGPLRLAVLSAGIGRATRLAVDPPDTQVAVLNELLAVNVVGLYQSLAYVTAAMGRTDRDALGQRGCIITVSSAAAFDGGSGTSAYAATKGAVASLTLPAARDLGPLGIRICCIAPGAFETPMHGEPTSETLERLSRNNVHPVRPGKPEEFASLVRHIYGNAYLNASIIRLDAGARDPYVPPGVVRE